MTDKEQPVERRKHKRYGASGGGVVLISASSPHCFKLGDIMDISVTGIALRYIGDQKLPDEFVEMTIIYCKRNFSLAGLPSKTVSHSKLSNRNAQGLPIRRWSLKFGKLTPEQQCHIKDFIRKQVAVEV